jgi:hypothetical protein
MNHCRANSPVPYCPTCGAVVNPELPRRECTVEQHTIARRQGSPFCVGCGAQLIASQA